MDQAPNVLLIVFDTARRDSFESFGASTGSTPALVDLATRGCALDTAYATSSWTLPSHASIFTGMLPRRLGLTQMPGGSMANIRPALEAVRDRLLPEVLGRNGYARHGWVTNHWVSSHAGFDTGFDSYAYVDSGRERRMNALLDEGRRSLLAWAREGITSRDDDGAAEVGRRLRESIGEWDGQPTFWFVNLSECHSPYLPPRPWNDLAARDRAKAALEAKRHLNFLSICLYAVGRHQVSDEAFERMRHLYHRAVSYMDAWLADVLEALDKRGILDNTLVIVTSDHGENFGESGLIAHGFAVNQLLVNVPLVIAGPGAPDSGRLLSLAELPQLIAEAAGIADAPWREDDLPRGVAISQLDPMATKENPKIETFVKEYSLEEEELGPLVAAYTSATDGRLKLVLRDGEELLYDLQDDPHELKPLTPGQVNGSADALRAALEHPALLDAPELRVAAGSSAPEASEDEVAAIERQMKLLGYM